MVNQRSLQANNRSQMPPGSPMIAREGHHSGRGTEAPRRQVQSDFALGSTIGWIVVSVFTKTVWDRLIQATTSMIITTKANRSIPIPHEKDLRIAPVQPAPSPK